MPNCFFRNQNNSFLRSLYSIFDMLTLQETLTNLYSSGGTSKTFALISYSYFLCFPLIFLNLKYKLNGSLNHMSRSWLVSLILQLFHLLVTSFRLPCFESDNSYFSMSDFHASCIFSLNYLTNTKGVSVRLITRKCQSFLFPS